MKAEKSTLRVYLLLTLFAIAHHARAQRVELGDVILVQPFVIIPEPVLGTIYVFDNSARPKMQLDGYNGNRIISDGRGQVYITNLGAVNVYDTAFNLIRTHRFGQLSSEDILNVSLGPSGRAVVFEQDNTVHVLTPNGQLERSVRLPVAFVTWGDVFPDECTVVYIEGFIDRFGGLGRLFGAPLHRFDICADHALDDVPGTGEFIRVRALADGVVGLDRVGLGFTDLKGHVVRAVEPSFAHLSVCVRRRHALHLDYCWLGCTYRA